MNKAGSGVVRRYWDPTVLVNVVKTQRKALSCRARLNADSPFHL